MKNVCVFAGSHDGAMPHYREAALTLGDELLKRGLGLVFGGASVGLMGALADRVVGGGGRTIGVIPAQLEEKEIAHRGLSELIVVGSMHERKARMAARADAFIALPGGFGTLDELFEIATWRQLGIHGKPIGIVNVRGYFDALLRFADLATAHGFVRARHRALLEVAAKPDAVLDLIGL